MRKKIVLVTLRVSLLLAMAGILAVSAVADGPGQVPWIVASAP